MNPLIVFTYWAFRKTNKIWEDDYNPIILSIASIRRWHEDVEIHVIDTSDREVDWADYPYMLNFKVFKQSPEFIVKQPRRVDTPSYMIRYDLLSKPCLVLRHLEKHKDRTVLVSDADICWIKPIYPLASDPEKICMTLNGGLYYLNSGSELAMKTLEMWVAYCYFASLNVEFCERIVAALGKKHIHDETVNNYMRKSFESHFYDIPYYENFALKYCVLPDFDPTQTKNLHFHANSIVPEMKLEKAKMFLKVKESRDVLEQKLGKRLKVFAKRYDVGEIYSIYETERIKEILHL